MRESSSRVFTFLRRYCQATAIGVVALGCLVLVGWEFHVRSLLAASSGFVPMKANTAVGLGLGGISLWLLLRGEFRAGQRRAARILGAVVALLGTATLAELVFGVNLRIDQLVVTDGTRFPGWTAPGRMAPTSAAEFLIIGLALVLVGWKTKRGRQPAQVLSLIAGLIGLMSVAGYLYHASALYRIQPYIQIAAHTAVAMSLLSLASTCADRVIRAIRAAPW